MEEFLLTIGSWLTAGSGFALPASFLWGLVSVLLSPCHMASIPLLVAYVAGQKMIPAPRQAARYAVLFAIGIFLTILMVGAVCALLGRILGDIGPWWQIGVGVVLLWVGWSLFKAPQCSAAGNVLKTITIQGYLGAFVLGLAYGLLAGVCTFGFIAPILGVITLHNQFFMGMAMLVFLGLGHCLPLVLCGMFSARAMEIMHSHYGMKTVTVLRKMASFILAALGVYFILSTYTYF